MQIQPSQPARLSTPNRSAKGTSPVPSSTCVSVPVVDDTDPVPVLAEVVERVISVHAADTSTTGTLSHVLLGTGLVPFVDLFGVLKQAGWDGWMCMEEGSQQGPEGVRAGAEFVRRTWEQA